MPNKEIIKTGPINLITNMEILKLSWKNLYLNFFSLLCILIFIFIGCSKKENQEESFLKKYDTREVLGYWKIVPSQQMSFIYFEEDGNAKIFHDNLPEEITILADANGLRLFHSKSDEVPFGYFLFSEKRENIWTGIYEDNLVRIERVQPKKKSVLE